MRASLTVNPDYVDARTLHAEMLVGLEDYAAAPDSPAEFEREIDDAAGTKRPTTEDFDKVIALLENAETRRNR